MFSVPASHTADSPLALVSRCWRVCRLDLLPNQPVGSLPAGFNSGQFLLLNRPRDT